MNVHKRIIKDAISEELIESVKRSEEDIKAGRYTKCKREKESEAFFKRILDEGQESLLIA